MTRLHLCAFAGTVLAVATPAQADDLVPYDLAISRLRACVMAGSGGAPTDSLGAAVVAVRSLCRPQIDRAYVASDRAVAVANPSADADRLAQMQRKARRAIDYDLATAVAQRTGMRP